MSHVVVALVASAGGLSAVRTVLETLPAMMPATVLVVIHQEPERVSRLPSLLARHCALPVHHAAPDDDLAVRQVIVAPPGRHLLVTPEGRLALIQSGAFPPNRPSADLLLVSMALALRDRAVAVVLSGRGHDGATGATAVHDFGGHVVTADRASSQDFGMPSAAIGRDDAVDVTMDVTAIGPHLDRVARSRACR